MEKILIIKSNSISKKKIKFVSYIKYKEYIRLEDTTKKFSPVKTVAKLKDKDKIPDFENILNDILIILPYENNEKLLKEDGWIEIWVII